MKPIDEFLPDYELSERYCKAVADVGRSSLSTETRIHRGDSVARRTFRLYWLVSRPFSGLTRILVLRAARRRAEAPA